MSYIKCKFLCDCIWVGHLQYFLNCVYLCIQYIIKNLKWELFVVYYNLRCCSSVRSIIFLVNKTNRCTEIHFYWYYNSTCFGQPFCPSSAVLSRTSALVHFMPLWWPFATGSRMELLLLVANDHHNCIKSTKADIRLRTADDGQKSCPKHVEL